MIRELKNGRRLASALCLATFGLFAIVHLARGGRLAEAAPAALINSVVHPGDASLSSALPRPPEPRWKSQLSWNRVREDRGGYLAVLHDGSRVELTLDPVMQHAVERALDGSPSPLAAAVVISVDDGRVLAIAGRDAQAPGKNEVALALKPWAPAASVFKLVTSSALVERGVPADARVCYHDGVHSVEASNLTSNARWDRSCNTFAYGLAKSQNAIIARLANDHLTGAILERTAHALGFGEALPFALPVTPSSAEVPRGRGLPFARVAAGFWQTTLSPLHGAWLAATIARGGVTPTLHLVDRVIARDGEVIEPHVAAARRVLPEEVARTVGHMMIGTTEFGTARHGFHDRKGRPVLPGVQVAGKTGSLDRKEGPFLAYSWFVGFAPAERPEVAVAVLLGNGMSWHKHAHQVAAEVLSDYFHGEGDHELPSRRVAAR
ncbi:MAG TPA: penicillin-binding transpeptidase domain-containing protein [Polyangia bacterium]